MKISIVTVVYNNAEHLEDCLISVFSQSYTDIEYIVIDGGSSDGSVGILNKYDKKISYWISEPDNGIYDALNKGINRATGDIIGILHSDDLFNSIDTIRHIAETFIEYKCDAVYGNLLYVSRDNPNQVIRFWKSKNFKFRYLKTGWMPPHPALFVSREWYLKKGNFRTDFRIAADYDLILRFFGDRFFRSFYLDEVITRMRTGGASNKSIRNIYRKSCEDLLALRQNKVGGVLSLFFKNFRKVFQFLIKPKIQKI